MTDSDSPQAHIDLEECTRFCRYLRVLHGPFGVTELVTLRATENRIETLSGFFDDAEAMVNVLVGAPTGAECYYGLNPRSADLFDSAPNCLRQLLQRGRATDVRAVTLLLIDIDVVSPARKQAATLAGSKKAPCTDREHAAAMALGRQLKDAYFPHGILVATNGAQLIVPVRLEGDTDTLQGFAAGTKQMLTTLKAHYFDAVDGVALEVDAAVADLPRIAAMPGTLKCKGKPTVDRPYRFVRADYDAERRLYVPTVEEEPPEEFQRACETACESPAERPRRRTVKVLPDPIVDHSPIVVRRGGLRLQSPRPLEALAYLCKGWNCIYTSVDSAPTGGRSAVLQALASKLLEVGYSVAATKELVAAHDARCGAKLRDVYSQDSYLDHLIARDYSVPACSWVVGAIGVCDQCLGCPAYHWRLTASGGQAPAPFRVQRPTPRPALLSLEEGRAQVRDGMSTFLTGLSTGAALLVKGPPGLGKTTAAIELVRNAVRGGQRVLYVTDRVTLVCDVVAKIGLGEQVVAVLGKRQSVMVAGESVPLCTQPTRIAAAETAGLVHAEGQFACGECPDRGTCGYQLQFQATGKTWVTTAAMLRHIVKEGRTMNSAAIVVLDEGARQAFAPDPIRVTRANLAKATNLGFQCDWLLTAWDAVVARPAEPAAGNRSQGKQFVWQALVEIRRTSAGANALHALRRAIAQHNSRCIASRQLQNLIAGSVVQLLWTVAKESKQVGPNSRLRIENGVIVVRRPLQLRLPQEVKLVVLDATGDQGVYERLLQRPTVVVDPQVRRQSRVIQYVSGRYGKTTQALDEVTSGRVLRLVRKITEKYGSVESPVAVVAFKGEHAKLRQALEGTQYILLPYWGTRGTNEVIERGCSHIVLVGTPTPNPDDIGAWEEARAAGEPSRVEFGHHWVLKSYGRFRDDKAVEVLEYDDPRVQAAMHTEREGEMLQAAERIRTCITGPGQKTVWLLTRHPVDGLAPDLLMGDINVLPDDTGGDA